MNENDLTNEWVAQLASAQRQLEAFETGKMRWFMNGVDRSDHHVKILKQIVQNYEKLLSITPGE